MTDSSASPAPRHDAEIARRSVRSPIWVRASSVGWRPRRERTAARDEHCLDQSNEEADLPPPFLSARYFPPMVDNSDEEEWTQDRIDDEFPLGDGDAETEAFVECPYCGETNEIALDPGSGVDQEYVEDCQVCCRPWLMRVRYSRDGSAEIEVIRSDS